MFGAHYLINIYILTLSGFCINVKFILIIPGDIFLKRWYFESYVSSTDWYKQKVYIYIWIYIYIYKVYTYIYIYIKLVRSDSWHIECSNPTEVSKMSAKRQTMCSPFC